MIVEINRSNKDLVGRAINEVLKYNDSEFISFDNEAIKNYLLLNNEWDIVGEVDYSISVDSADILFIYIKEEYRRRGFAKELLTKSFCELKLHGVNEVFLEVNESNISAYNLYKSLDFENVGERPNYYKDGNKAIIMRKEI